jgi:hypothetical protein
MLLIFSGASMSQAADPSLMGEAAPTLTRTPIPSGDCEIFLGSDGSDETLALAANEAEWRKVYLPESQVINALSARAASQGFDARLAIYSDVSGQPDSPLASTAVVTLSADSLSSFFISPLALGPGNYWLMINTSTAGQLQGLSETGTVDDYSMVDGSTEMPRLPAGVNARDSHFTVSLVAQGCGPTPTAVATATQTDKPTESPTPTSNTTATLSALALASTGNMADRPSLPVSSRSGESICAQFKQAPTSASMTIFNLQAEKIATVQMAGKSLCWQTRGVGAGRYFARISADGVETIRGIYITP